MVVLFNRMELVKACRMSRQVSPVLPRKMVVPVLHLLEEAEVVGEHEELPSVLGPLLHVAERREQSVGIETRYRIVDHDHAGREVK